MSVEEDIEVPETELKELVTQALEENGLLSKIRAQLRAGLYVALENEINESDKHCHINSSLKHNLANAEIRTIFCLVIEFLEYFNMDFTKSVFEKESFLGILFNYEGKEKLIKDLEIGIDKITKTPLLIEILNIARNSYKYSTKLGDNESFQNVSSFINDTQNVNNATYDVPNSEKKLPIDELDAPENNYKHIETKSGTNSIDTSISSVESKNSDKESKPPSNEYVNDIKKVNVFYNIQKSLKTEEDLPKFETDDTYEGTSSIADDSIASNNKDTPLIDFDKTAKIPSSSTNSPVATVKCIIDQTIFDSSIYKQNDSLKNLYNKNIDKTSTIKSLLDQTVADSSVSKSSSLEKNKSEKIVKVNSSSTTQSLDDSPLNKSPRLSDSSEKKKHDKTDKPKPMSGLSSLADLPPLQVTKARSPDTVLLPSLYSKEFREKSNLKEIDKLLDINFDSIDNYEEDDILSASIDYDKHKNVNTILSKSDYKGDCTKSFAPIKLFDNDNKKIVDKSEKSVSSEKQSSSDLNRNLNLSENKKDADTTSISEDLDFNSNSDDIVKSERTKL